MVEKVVIYITQGDKLLVFRHTQYPQAGIQVPAGTVKAGEDLRHAAFREAHEETGLSPGELILVSRLGSDTIRVGSKQGIRPTRRYFFHLEYVGAAPASWIHYEKDPSAGPEKGPIEFEFYWQKYPEEIPRLAGKLDAKLADLKIAR